MPSKKAEEQAIALFRRIAPEAQEVIAKLRDRPGFIHCGAHFKKIYCPFCRRELDMEWWLGWMGKELRVGFPFNPAALPCCGGLSSLVNLLYHGPQGFARFSLEAMKPNIRELTKAVEREFEVVLGCGIRKIWRCF